MNRLYHVPLSPFCRKVRLTLAEKRIANALKIERAMLDKDCRIGKGVRIRDHDGDADFDDPAGRYHFRDGIVCVPRAAVIPDGLEI